MTSCQPNLNMSNYDRVPKDTSLKLTSFTVAISDEELNDFKELLRLSRLGPKTYENLQKDGRFGVTYEWMLNAKIHWETKFDWRRNEEHINSFPNYLAQIEDDGGEVHDVHFVALFSEKPDAIPLMCIHGWPGSFLEFLDMLSVFRTRYTSRELPYHLIIPSLPGYAFSSTPSLQKDWSLTDSACLLNKLMVGLGFGSGYAVQGGDIGSYTSRIMAAKYDSCKAMHLNFCVMPYPENAVDDNLPLEETEKEGLDRGDTFGKTGTAYALEHTTRPATIGFVLSSSPLALLAWIGEKFQDWTDTTPSLDQILETVTLYWLTDTFPRAIYPYRGELVESASHSNGDNYRDIFKKGPARYMLHSDPRMFCHKPFGYSWNPKEIAPIPKSWAATTGNLVWFKRHTKGGHFAAMEQPDTMADDIEEFLGQVWPCS
jgi:microsomal epoxide hydrolase